MSAVVIIGFVVLVGFTIWYLLGAVWVGVAAWATVGAVYAAFLDSETETPKKALLGAAILWPLLDVPNRPLELVSHPRP